MTYKNYEELPLMLSVKDVNVNEKVSRSLMKI